MPCSQTSQTSTKIVVIAVGRSIIDVVALGGKVTAGAPPLLRLPAPGANIIVPLLNARLADVEGAIVVGETDEMLDGTITAADVGYDSVGVFGLLLEVPTGPATTLPAAIVELEEKLGLDEDEPPGPGTMFVLL